MEITSGTVCGLFRTSTIEKIKTFKSALLKLIIWTLVGGAILGAFAILTTDSSGGAIIGKFMGTLFILAGAALVTVIDFNGIDGGIKSAQALACMGVAMNICWAFFWILAIWGVFDIWEPCIRGYYCSRIYSFFGRITFVTSYLSALGLFGSYIMGLFEGTKRSVIRPLKITSMVCLTYTELHLVFSAIFQGGKSVDVSDYDRFGTLAYFTGFVWFITLIIAMILSRRERNIIEYAEKKKKADEQQQILAQAAANVSVQPIQSTAPKTDEELRAEIEEKVRRELIEKEVREKLEKEMAEKKVEETIDSNKTDNISDN